MIIPREQIKKAPALIDINKFMNSASKLHNRKGTFINLYDNTSFSFRTSQLRKKFSWRVSNDQNQITISKFVKTAYGEKGSNIPELLFLLFKKEKEESKKIVASSYSRKKR